MNAYYYCEEKVYDDKQLVKFGSATADQMPDDVYKETHRRDLYINYFGSEAEARTFYADNH